VAGPLYVKVDWNRDGDFADPLEDVTGDVRGGITATYGRDSGSALSPVVSGAGGFDLDNTLRRYSPRNAASPLFGKLKPARPVLITRDVTVGTTTTNYTIFRGHTSDQPLNPDVESQLVSLSLVDYLADFGGTTISTPLYQGIRTGDAIGYILDAAGWTGGRDIDTGATTISWWWEDGTDALQALQRVLASEGPPAMLSVGVGGEIIFRDREHRLTRAASKTSQATMKGTEGAAEPVMGRGFKYNDGWTNVINSVQITVNERQPKSVGVVWQTDDVIYVGASSSTVVVLQASDPFTSAVAPVQDIDYSVVTGSVTSATLSRTSGLSTSITYTAGAGGASINGIQLRAISVPVVRTYQVTSSDSASITDYGQRGIPANSDIVWVSRYDAQGIADLLVLQRKQPLTQLTVRFNASDLQQSRLNKVLSLDLSDRVTVVEPETQVSGDFFVESIAHTISGVHEHEVILSLEAVPSSPTGVFIIGTSTLNGADPLGY
jgi:hypothetical protein